MAIEIQGGVAQQATVPTTDAGMRSYGMRMSLDQISPENAADVVRQLVRTEDKLTVDVAKFNSAI